MKQHPPLVDEAQQRADEQPGRHREAQLRARQAPARDAGASVLRNRVLLGGGEIPVEVVRERLGGRVVAPSHVVAVDRPHPSTVRGGSGQSAAS